MELFVIEDEKKTAAFPGQGVARSRFAVELAHDGEAGLRRARAPEFDLLIVDVMPVKERRLGSCRRTASRRHAYRDSFSYCSRQCARPCERTRVGSRRLSGQA